MTCRPALPASWPCPCSRQALHALSRLILDGPSYSHIASPSGHIIAVKLAHGRRHRQRNAVRLLDESRLLQFLLILCLVLCRLSSCGVHAAKRRNLRTLRMRCAWCCTPTRRSA